MDRIRFPIRSASEPELGAGFVPVGIGRVDPQVSLDASKTFADVAEAGIDQQWPATLVVATSTDSLDVSKCLVL
jgi:hypothetical protein